MTAVAGTSESYDFSNSLREDLEDVIWDLFPADTWCLTNFDRVDAKSTSHDWLLDSLEAATANAQVEGDDASYATITAPLRYDNATQISRKTFIVSGTIEAVKLAGRKSEIARQTMKQMRELKRDIEKAIVGANGACAGSQAVGRQSAGMESWIASSDHGGNAVKATSTNAGSTVGYSSGTVTAPTDGGSFGGLAQTNLDHALELAWEDGGDARVILINSTHKSTLDGFTSRATNFVDTDKGQVQILTSANVYVSDYGRHTVMLHRYLRTNPSVALCVDPDYWATAWLRRPATEPLAKTGDGEKRMIICEWTLVARNPNASAKVFALS